MDNRKNLTPETEVKEAQIGAPASDSAKSGDAKVATEAAKSTASDSTKSNGANVATETAKSTAPDSAKSGGANVTSETAKSTASGSAKSNGANIATETAKSTDSDSAKSGGTNVATEPAKSTTTESAKSGGTNVASETAKSTASATTAASTDWHDLIPKMMTVSTSPHIHAADTTRTIMLDVCIALMPALIWGIYVFGFRALTVTLISVVFAVLSEAAYQKLMRKPITVLDFSAVVTGILLALNLPVSVPLWMPAIGSIFAVVVVKQLFGGIGKNFVNPALAARVFLFAWPSRMSYFTPPREHLSPFAMTVAGVDAVSTATPLASLKTMTIPDEPMLNMILGWEAGCIGEISALMLTAGFIYLLVRRVISWQIPVCYIGTVAVVCYIASKSTLPFVFTGAEIFSGGLFLGAIFMATDYATSPITELGRVIYAVGCGLLTCFIRFFGGYPEGVSFSILIMNLLVWYLDRYTKPVRF